MMCLHPNTELGKAPMALHFEEKKCLSTPEPTPLNKVQQKGHSAHLGFSRMGIKLLFFFLRMDLNHRIWPWSFGIWDHAALFLEPSFILRTYLEAFF